VQAPGDIPVEFRVAMHDRIYGCDDCQDVCPENRVTARRVPPPAAPPATVATVDLVWLATANDADILERFGRWWLPDRNPDILRRNAVVALGNVGDPNDDTLAALLAGLTQPNSSALVATHAAWALGALAARR
jgi:epoxyqueuosine reductase